MGFIFPQILFYVITNLWKTLKSHLRWKLLPGSAPLKNLPFQTFTPKQERKATSKMKNYWQTSRTSLSIISPLALPLPNYEETITNNVGTETYFTTFELVYHDYSLLHNDQSSN